MAEVSLTIQGSTLIFKVTCPFGQVRFEIHLSCMRCHLSTNPNPCRNMGIVQFCATTFDFSPVPSDKWHCKTTCPRSHFQHFYLSWTVGQPLRSSPAILSSGDWLSLDLTDDWSTLFQVMVRDSQATGCYLRQCSPRSMLPYSTSRSQWVKRDNQWKMHIQIDMAKETEGGKVVLTSPSSSIHFKWQVTIFI